MRSRAALTLARRVAAWLRSFCRRSPSCKSSGVAGACVPVGLRGGDGDHGLAARIMRWACTIQAFASCSLANPSIVVRDPLGFAISTSKRCFARGITR